MTNFAERHVLRWKDGAFFDLSEACDQGRVVIVNYDQTNNGYLVDSDEQNAFLAFVAEHWGSDNDWQRDGELYAEYLDRIGVSIYEV